ncbi:putative Ig domain-containing protein [Rhizobium sp. NTR19]|uniref:Ig domain-containing protein n=1 Tax=Neorhizobium turbinariae TaxID=2937795 RepID=A0ABT0IX96_9HYPH|nr:putative Ig domain-containing protein [Neorhizobium turbinariae]MCK8782505.1 putative Ig domain-containing protein [Neorhizobium turbinariae]
MSPAVGVPTGTVTFSGAGISETVALNGTGVAQVTSTSLTSGTITAIYNGDSHYEVSSSTVAVDVKAPLALSPAAGALPAGNVGSIYSQAFTVTGGTAPYTYTLSGDHAPGLTLNSTTGVLSGTLTVSDGFSFTIQAVDDAGRTVSAAYTLAVAPAEPVATSTTVAASPSTSVAGETVEVSAVVQSLAAGSGTPTGTVTFTGAGLNQTVTLDAAGSASVTSTSLTSGTITATYNGDSQFSGSAGTATVTVNAPNTLVFTPAGGSLAEAMAGEEYSQPISATGGSGAITYRVASGSLPERMVLNVSTGELTGPSAEDAEGNYTFTIEARDGTGATGTATFSLKVNPRAVTAADQVISVPEGSSPPNVYLNRGATGGPFISANLVFVEPSFAGRAEIIQGELAQAGPVSPVGWYLKFTPSPGYSGQAKVGYRLVSALGSSSGTVTYHLSYAASQVAEEIDSLVHDFVRTRQSLIANAIKVPGLMERRQMAKSSEAVTTKVSPSERGLTLGFSTSLAQMEAARDAADGVTDAIPSLFNVWIDGTFLAHNRDGNGNGKWGSFAALSIGADYLLTEKALVGLSFHYDYMKDPTEEDAELTGNGWLAGPYASLEIGNDVFWDTSILYGGSSNDIDTLLWDGSFDTTRWLFDTSIKGQWQLDDVTVLTPKLRAVYFSEKVEDYSVRNDLGDVIEIDGFREEQFRVSLGAEISRQFNLDNGSTLTPKLGATVGYSGLDGAGAFGNMSLGASLNTADEWNIDAGALFGIEGDGQRSAGVKVGISKRF